MIIQVRHCTPKGVEVLISEDHDGINPARQFGLSVSQVGRRFSVCLDTGDSIDFEPATEFDAGELHRPQRLYTHRSDY